jgi:uncharacterized protein YjbI with pentapeptide repeats
LAPDDRTQFFALDISGLFLAGADLSHARLEGAILTRTQLQGAQFIEAQLKGASLTWAQLEGADLSKAQLEDADLNFAQLKRADLSEARLKGGRLNEAQLQDASLSEAHLEGADLRGAQLQGADLRWSQLQGGRLFGAHLEDALLEGAELQGADLGKAQLNSADLSNAQLQGASLRGARLESAHLFKAQLESADLRDAQLEGADLSEAQLAGADLRQASLDKKTNLSGATLTDVRLDGVIFDNTNLSVVDWALVPRLQDHRLARESYDKEGKPKSRTGLRSEYQAAARAYRLLSVALQAKGMSEEAATSAYRAQVMQRRVYRYSGPQAWGRWFFSGLLDALAGYGYKPGRSVVIYLVVIALFTGIYYALGATVGPHLSPYEAAVVSLTAFHSRGFFATTFQPSDPQAGVAALEAVIGLLIEISFIATFTQRFFGAK